jgi:hypothetical protein
VVYRVLADPVIREIELLYVLAQPLDYSEAALLAEAVVREVELLHGGREVEALAKGDGVVVAHAEARHVDLVLLPLVVH